MQIKHQERYNRQIILKGFGNEAQHKLAAAKVLVAGAGGLGCPALQYLVAAGVGRIGIVDQDIVSLSNLHRQVLYTTDDIGKLKADLAVKKLSALNPEVEIEAYPYTLNQENILGLLQQYDMIIDGTDNFPSRYLINDASALLGKPLIYGAVMQYEGQVAIFNVTDEDSLSTNYRDLFPDPPQEGEVLNCAEAGVLGVLPGIIGTLQASETIKLITGIGTPLVNRLLTYNILSNRQYEIRITASSGKHLLPKNEADFLRSAYHLFRDRNKNSVIEIDADRFNELRKQSSPLVIDVREKSEFPPIINDTIAKIPMSAINENISEIKAGDVIFVCSHGVRSLHAANILSELSAGKKRIYSLKGGLSKYWDELDLK